MINVFTSTIMAFNLLALLIMGWMLYAPIQLAEVYNEPFPVRPTEVHLGEDLEFQVHFKKTGDYAVTSNRNIICDDGNLVTLAPKESNAPKGEYKTWTSVTIPQKASVGECYLEMTNTYYINALRTEERELRTQSFTIIE